MSTETPRAERGDLAGVRLWTGRPGDPAVIDAGGDLPTWPRELAPPAAAAIPARREEHWRWRLLSARLLIPHSSSSGLSWQVPLGLTLRPPRQSRKRARRRRRRK